MDMYIDKNRENYVVIGNKEEKLLEKSSYDDCLQYIKDNSSIDIPSFYVIKDLMTWTVNSKEKSKIERYEKLEDAIIKFQEYRNEEYNKPFVLNNDIEYTRLALGVRLGEQEIDILHVRNGKNFLVPDFQFIKEFYSNFYFIQALNDVHQRLCFDYINIYRYPTNEEKREEILRNGKIEGFTEEEILQKIQDKTFPKEWDIEFITEKQRVSSWDNCYLKKQLQEKKYLIDGNLKVVDCLLPGDEIRLKSGTRLIIEKRISLENETLTGKSILLAGKEECFSFDEITKLCRGMCEIKPKTINEKIVETKDLISKIEVELARLQSEKPNKYTESEIIYETRLLKRHTTNLLILEAYKKSPFEKQNQKLVEQIQKNSYVKKLAEKAYINENGMLNKGFEKFYEDIKKRIEKDGIDMIVAELKDEIYAYEKENIVRSALGILRGKETTYAEESFNRC